MDLIVFTGKILLSAVLGASLGWQRLLVGKAAGPRTYAMVCLGATLFTMLSRNVQNGDEGRIAAQIIAGIGFIGAGTILHKEDGVEGLTTAAGLWASAAIGMAIGFDWYPQAIIASILMYIVLAIKDVRSKHTKVEGEISR